MKQTKLSAAVRAAFPHTIPIMTGYLAVGLAYGVLMASKGYNFLWSGFVSAFAFCGSMQYVAITLLTSVFDPAQEWDVTEDGFESKAKNSGFIGAHLTGRATDVFVGGEPTLRIGAIC